MKATRDGFGDALMEMGEHYDNILALDADLGGATKILSFGKKFPNRYYQLGIAEANMIGVASGLSEYGFKVFLASFGAFLTGRYDIIRCSIAYPCQPVVLVGSHVGMAIGKDGVTQMGLEDVSLMRALPNMKILNPATYNQARSIVKYLCDKDLKNPHYLRLGRQPVAEAYEKNVVFEFGKGIVHKVGSMGVVFSTGCVLQDVLEAAKDIDITVIDMPTIKPLDVEIIKKYSIGNVFTVEDHSIIGGLGSAVAEVIAEEGLEAKLNRIGVNDQFPESGLPSDLYSKYGLSTEKINERIVNVLDK